MIVRAFMIFLMAFFSTKTAFSAEPYSFLTDQERLMVDHESVRDIVAGSVWPEDDVLEIALMKATLSYARKSYQCNVVSQIDIGEVRYGILDAATGGLIDSGKIKSVWHFLGSASMCGQKKTHKYALLQKSNGGYDAFILIPGASHAWGSLLRDLTRPVNGVVYFESVKKMPKCPDNDLLRFTNSEIIDDKQLGPQLFGIRLQGSWQERWTVERCGLEVSVVLKIRADGQGGAFFDVPGELATSKPITPN